MSTPACLVYLADHVDWLAHRPEAEEAFEELHAAVATLYAAIDTAAASKYAGPCEVCGRDMYAREGAAWVECRPCGVRHDVDERREWLLGMVEDRLERAALIAHALTGYGYPITPERIRSWAQHGLLLAHGQDERGRALYRVGDVRQVLNKEAEKARRRGSGRSA